jgi:hypothetical protein
VDIQNAFGAKRIVLWRRRPCRAGSSGAVRQLEEVEEAACTPYPAHSQRPTSAQGPAPSSPGRRRKTMSLIDIHAEKI